MKQISEVLQEMELSRKQERIVPSSVLYVSLELLEKCKQQDKNKIPIVIDHKTTILVKKGLSKKKTDSIIKRYSSPIIKSQIQDSII